MPLSTFLSGVSADFRKLRGEIASELRKFRNLSISPIIQEDLSESSDFNGALVDKLISNIRSCRLVICLVGSKAGYPIEEAERRKVMSLVRERLETSFGRLPDSLGELWDSWEKKNLGMTYTQLEFFVASVFAEDTRCRVMYQLETAKKKSSTASTEVANDIQLEFRKFLLQHQTLIDWVESKDFVRDCVQIAVELAVQMRDSSGAMSSLIEAREAISRGVLVLSDLNLRRQLTLPQFQNFYRKCVWPRLSECLVEWTRSSDILTTSIAQANSQFWVTEAAKEICVVHFAPPLAEIWAFTSDLQLTQKWRVSDFDAYEQFCSVSRDGNWLLTYSDAKGYTIRRKGEVLPSWQSVRDELRLHDFTGDLPAIYLEDTGPRIAIRNASRWELYSVGGEPLGEVVDVNNLHRSDFVFPRTGKFEIGDVAQGRASVDLYQKSYGLDANNHFVFVEVGVRQFQIRNYSCVYLLDIFQVDMKDCGREIIAKQPAVIGVQGQIELQLSTSPHGHVVYSFPLPGNEEFEAFRQINPQGKQMFCDGVHYVTPVEGRYSWSKSRCYLIMLEEGLLTNSNDRTPQVVVRLYHFPHPLSYAKAKSMLENLEAQVMAREQSIR